MHIVIVFVRVVAMIVYSVGMDYWGILLGMGVSMCVSVRVRMRMVVRVIVRVSTGVSMRMSVRVPMRVPICMIMRMVMRVPVPMRVPMIMPMRVAVSVSAMSVIMSMMSVPESKKPNHVNQETKSADDEKLLDAPQFPAFQNTFSGLPNKFHTNQHEEDAVAEASKRVQLAPSVRHFGTGWPLRSNSRT